MYDDEEEQQTNKIKIPKYKILHADIEMPKKENEVLNTFDKMNNSTKKEDENKVNLIEKILECNLNFFKFKIK